MIEGWDPELDVANMIERCKRTRKQWASVYDAIGVEFKYTEPSAEEYLLAIKNATAVVKQRKKKK